MLSSGLRSLDWISLGVIFLQQETNSSDTNIDNNFINCENLSTQVDKLPLFDYK